MCLHEHEDHDVSLLVFTLTKNNEYYYHNHSMIVLTPATTSRCPAIIWILGSHKNGFFSGSDDNLICDGHLYDLDGLVLRTSGS